jgi:hypothetical protein
MSLILVGFYCESTRVLTLQNFINKHITNLENAQGKKKFKKKNKLQVLCYKCSKEWESYKYPSALGFLLWNPRFSYD